MQGNSPSDGGRDTSGIAVGIFLLVLAGVLWLDTVRMGGGVSYGVGPTVVPKLIAGGLVLFGLLSILSGWRAARPDLEPVDWKSVGTIVGGFLLLTVLIGLGGGFIPAMAILFALTARAFGRNALLVDLALGAVVALLTYLLFSKLLTLSLPQGPLERLLG